MRGAVFPNSPQETEVDDLDEACRRALLRFFRARVGSHAEAEDLTQEVFVRVLGRQTSAPDIENPGGFIFTAATNLLRDRARRRSARPNEIEIEKAGPNAAALVEDRASDRVLIGRERLAEVLSCLDELPPRTRDSFLLFKVQRMKQRDIAKALGVSVSAVEKHIIRATAHLAERFGAREAEGRNAP